MNILALADRPPSRPIPQLVEEGPIDLIITLGDLDQSQISDLEGITHIPKIGVYGNHCSGTYMEPLGIMNVHMCTWEYQGLRFGGFEGCVRYKASPYAKMYTQEEASALLAGFPPVDVFISHCPPYGVNDDPSDTSHTGFIGLREYILRSQPQTALHGHTYPTTPQTQLGQTRIVYVSGEQAILV